MNLRQMEVFRAVMAAGSITGAAKILHVSQPAVTALIKHTEDQLKLPLFERAKGRLTATPEALILYQEIEEVFDRVTSVHRVLEGLKQSRMGSLKIVSLPVLGSVLIPTAIGRFLVSHSQTTVAFDITSRREMLERLASGVADIGFGYLLPDHGGILREELKRARLRCIMHRDHPLARRQSVTLGEASSWPIVAFKGRGLAPVIRSMFVDARLERNLAVEVSLTHNAWAVVNEGAAISIVDPHSRIDTLFPHVVSIELDAPATVALEVVFAKDRPMSRLATTFISRFREQLASI